MKILNREQVTEVEIKRQITHYVKHDGNIYKRTSTKRIYLPYMGNRVVEDKSNINWSIYVRENVTRPLSKKEVKELDIEEIFMSQAVKEINGDVHDFFEGITF